MDRDSISKSVYIIKECLSRFKNPVVMWSTGKDSTVMLDLIRKASPGGKITIPVVHIDTGKKFKEIYEYRDRLAKEWDLPLMVIQNPNNAAYSPDKQGAFECCMALKTNVLKDAVKKYKWDAIIMSIRQDEADMRMIERYFSPRDEEFKWNFIRMKTEEEMEEGDSPFKILQETELSGWSLFQTEFEGSDHVRVHPILHWSESDIWEYIEKNDIPINPLYFSKNGKRYRSLGCACCTEPMKSDACTVSEMIEELKTTDEKERDGRSQSKESILRRLRTLGYM